LVDNQGRQKLLIGSYLGMVSLYEMLLEECKLMGGMKGNIILDTHTWVEGVYFTSLRDEKSSLFP
jgi:hypothetical protein